MILTFSDLHLGLKHQSKHEELGLYTSEIEAYKCLDYIFEYCADKSNNITLVIFKGDWYHTNIPSSTNNKRTINWLTKFNELGIKFIAIPGNHSCTVYSNALSFIHELKLENITLFDSLDTLNHYKYEDYNIYFIPYKYSDSMKERDINVESEFSNTFSKITTSNNILVGHVHEVSASIGSESLMIAKGVELIDVESVSNTVLILLGHIHKHQIYEKKGVPIVFTGSTYFQDKSDVNQKKGFCVIADPRNIKFVPIPNIRKYHKVGITSAILTNLNSLLTNRKFTKGDVIYFDSIDIERDGSLEEILMSKCQEYFYVFGGISYKTDISSLEGDAIYLTEDDNPNNMFKEWVNSLKEEEHILDQVYTSGSQYIDNYYKV